MFNTSGSEFSVVKTGQVHSYMRWKAEAGKQRVRQVTEAGTHRSVVILLVARITLRHRQEKGVIPCPTRYP